jgi:hypothetical protein
MKRWILLLVFLGMLSWAIPAAEPKATLQFRHGDVIAFLGGGDVAAAQFTAHLESLITFQAAGKNLRFRNFGWEGDTVFEQPRDFGFPALIDRVQKVKPNLIFVQYGRGEALQGKRSVADFRKVYGDFVGKLSGIGKVLLVTPPPFETPEEPLPNVALRNAALAEYVQAIRDLGKEKELPVLDLFETFADTNQTPLKLTSDGLQLTPKGHALVAQALARLCGFNSATPRAGEVSGSGEWPNSSFEKLRQAIIAKNRLWFDFSRPQNWAFLGGDRVTQPSSRDHRDPNKRWFPEEMEQFPNLIAQKEEQIWKMAEAMQ